MCFRFIVVEAIIEYSDIEAAEYYPIVVAASIGAEEHRGVEEPSEEEGD